MRLFGNLKINFAGLSVELRGFLDPVRPNIVPINVNICLSGSLCAVLITYLCSIKIHCLYLSQYC